MMFCLEERVSSSWWVSLPGKREKRKQNGCSMVMIVGVSIGGDLGGYGFPCHVCCFSFLFYSFLMRYDDVMTIVSFVFSFIVSFCSLPSLAFTQKERWAKEDGRMNRRRVAWWYIQSEGGHGSWYNLCTTDVYYCSNLKRVDEGMSSLVTVISY
ncbi:hypothetical protein B0H65DRAFT_200264 [Neurospora tetraspora]|uniref:Uncharacterized protein n=1 Tax=Neurospora tetraspora TaxID=94610 RepID=A0AAE0JFJ7_9PEZI|nr:hypothetical protein B0H65DRAFT_200264 [Neurospora tetraspora]